jgi:type I restriction-modification system DNA methylase subunit
MTKEGAKKKITQLVEKYKRLDQKEIKSYNEANTRRNFIELLFAELGWSVYDRKEVSEEERASKGRVDYAFKLSGISQFYLEAKALKEDLNKEEYIQQAVEYAYNKGVTWAILSNFESTHVYAAQTNKLCLNLQAGDYVERFDDLWLLSRESFQANLIGEWGVRYGHLPEKQRIEDKLFRQLKRWRDALFKQIHHYNRQLTHSETNEVIQRFFNRLIFIRNCEDRKLENNMLRAMLNEWRTSGCKGELIEKLQRVFRYFADPYDSDLFEPHLTDSIYVESATVEEIINGLYKVPGSIANYDFSIMEPDVLGSVYEQYLGYVTSLRKKDLEEQQEVIKKHRKEQGIYYTPTFVTNYIVKETVGQYLKDHTHHEILNMKILDPACGSGSFLIRAFDELLNYHAGVASKPVVELDQHERLRVLLSNIFGVDLDKQAVEIARLNLLLRTLTQRAKLEMLDNNIQCGNSLVSGAEEILKNYFGKNWKDKEPFNWEDKFPNIMANGGFDVVIGNPPYVQMSMDARTEQGMKEYLLATFGSSMGRLNTFGFFVRMGISLLKPQGILGFIIPNTFLTQEYYRALREFILNTCQLINITTLEEMPFPRAVVENVIIILRREPLSKARTQSLTRIVDLGGRKEHTIRQSFFNETSNCSFTVNVSPKLNTLRKKIDARSVRLNTLVNINQAIALKQDRKSCLFREARNAQYKKVLDGRDVGRYALSFPNNYLLYDISKIHSCKREDIFNAKEKILLRRVGDRIIATLDKEQYYALNTLVVITPKSDQLSLKFILGLLNSRLLNNYYALFLKSTKKVFSEIQARQLGQLPIHQIDPGSPAESEVHDRLVSLVEKMLELNEKLQKAHKGLDDWHDIQKQIQQTGKKIDTLVYDLYELTETERRTVESATN